MKELFQKMMKKLRKHSEAAGAIAALLLIVLFFGSDDPGNPYAERKCAGKSDRWHEEKLDGHADRARKKCWQSKTKENGSGEAADAESAVRKSGYAGDGERIVKRKRS